MNNLIKVSIIPQPMDDNFNQVMDEAYKQQQIALAAPDLLAALERIMNAHNSGNNGAYMGEAVVCRMFAEQANEAIAKARGE